MKGIAWEDTLYTIAPGDAIQILETGIVICPREQDIADIQLNLFEDKEIKARYEKDDLFKKMIKPVLGNIISQLLVNDSLHILDLRSSVLTATIEVKEESKIEPKIEPDRTVVPPVPKRSNKEI